MERPAVRPTRALEDACVCAQDCNRLSLHEAWPQVLTGDFSGDGRTDIALTGAAGWATIHVATSNGDGSFTVTNSPVGACQAR
jgi:hypothetical protein